MKCILGILMILFVLKIGYGQTSANYSVEFESIWNSVDHTSLPSSAHWSRLVGATHQATVNFLEVGGFASTGIQDVAERGVNTAFKAEVDAAIDRGLANQYINGDGLSTGAGTVIIENIVVDVDFPMISLLSMIAPSPDWFIAVISFNLLNGDGTWKNETEIDLFAYDAGTDDGSDYTSSNAQSNPKEVIKKITTPPIQGNRIGRVIIKRVDSETKHDHFEKEQAFISPNPLGYKQLKLTNWSDRTIKTVHIYNFTGEEVWRNGAIKHAESVQKDLSELERGIYFAKFTMDSGEIRTEKIVIK